MKAKAKPRAVMELDSLGVESGDHLTYVSYAAPVKRQKGVMVADVPALVDALKQKGLL